MFKNLQKTVIKVDGMSCQNCATRVTKALESIDGVKKVSVDLENKQVSIISKEKIEESNIKKIIEDLGYVYDGIVDI